MCADTLTLSITRNLSNTLYEKRKIGALEVEQAVKDLRAQGDLVKLKKMIQYLADNYTYSVNGNSKKGGLIALAACVIGLQQDSYRFLHMVIPPVLKCFSDADHRVRYYACEALYNISKVAGPLVLQYFCEIFDGLCKLAADPEKGVQDGALLLNKQLQDVVRESDVFDLERFVPLLERRIYHPHPAVRQYLIGWVKVLDSVPTLDMLEYLPNILDGMLHMMGDRRPEIGRDVAGTLSGFLGEIKARESTTVDFGTLTSILVKHCAAENVDEYTHYVALGWLHQFIVSGQERLLAYTANLLNAVLPSISNDVNEIRETAVLTNEALLTLLRGTALELPMEAILDCLKEQFLNANVATRVAALNWVRILHERDASSLAPYLESLFPALIKKIGDASEKVVSLSLEVMAKISQREQYFDLLVQSLVDLFAADQGLQSARGALIIRQLSLFIDPAKIFTALSKILLVHKDLAFSAIMIQTLSVILLTSRELRHLRERLRTFQHSAANEEEAAATARFFVTLYEAFSHNSVATVSLCLLCEMYEHAAALISIVACYEMTVDFLCEMDKLVQLIESPVFAPLRLQLLDPAKHPFLFRALYALLMVLPQSAAFVTLQRRLSCVNTICLVDPKPTSASEHRLLNFEELRQKFVAQQNRQVEFRDAARQAKYRETLTENTIVGRNLLEVLHGKRGKNE